ncbi:MAG: TonB-dependent receptor [Acidobacteria bacterium]|nr:TonB-dependent receptor [Acidobacteriota bacterium]
MLRSASFGTAALGVAILLSAAQPAAAQQNDQPESDETPQFTEEVTVRVTARKREENLQSVPFSVVAQTQQVLRNRGANSIEDVSANVAGFSVQNLGPGQSQIAMRGVSAGQIVRDQPGVKEQVGVYLDESVVSLSLFTPDLDLFDMSRIEVLRGPQGTLFGSGSLSGTVRYITNQPELGVLEGTGELGFDSLHDGGFGNDAKFAVNLPMGEAAAARVTAYNTVLGGFMDAVQPGGSTNEDVNRGRRTGARVAFLIQPNERFSVTPRILYQDVSMDGWNRIDDYNILANPYTTTRPPVRLGERELFTQFEEPFSDGFLLGDLKVEYDFGGLLLTSITSITKRDVEVVRDSTALAASVIGGTIGLGEDAYTLDAPLIDTTTAIAVTEELRLSGSRDRVDWVGGFFYSDADRRYGQSLPITGFEAATGIPTHQAHAARDELFFSDLDYDFAQLALFGEVSVAITERFNLTGGLRWYDFDEHRIQTFDGIFADAGTNRGSISARGAAPRFIASYDVTDATQMNAQISKGFRLGGINDPLNVPICTPRDLETFGNRDTWEDEELWNYEVGAKSTFLGGQGTLNVSGFYMDIRNLQATVTAGSCSSRIIFNVPESRSAGMELEIAAQPTPLFDFAIAASVADGRLQSTLESYDADGNSTGIIAGIEEGKRLPTTPLFQTTAAATWRWLMGNRVGYVSGTFQHVGSRFTQIGDQAAGFGAVNLLALPNTVGGPLTEDTFQFEPELPAYNLLNLRIGVLTGAWDIAFFVNNLTDERALLALDQERGTLARVGYLTNPPRRFGLSTRFDF